MSNLVDQLIVEIDRGLKFSASNTQECKRPYPAETTAEVPLTEIEKNYSAGLMRVNHAGEVCAQALYRGQSLTTELNDTRDQMKQAADEELDHLAWCSKRLEELGAETSILNPLWYVMSFSIGILTGLTGDKRSLGFVEETEKQVVRHLDKHLDELSDKDIKTKAILEQMRADEDSHALRAKEAGASELPEEIKAGMSWIAKIMTSTSYYI
jgi:ubiquinone biosynthesis monooxygenase Coq7